MSEEDNKPAGKDTNSIESILNNLREANKDYVMWDKLADASLDRKGYNDFYPKDTK